MGRLSKRKLIHTGEERLPQRVMLGEIGGAEGFTGLQEKDWSVHLKEDMSVFRIKFESWRMAAQKAGIYYRRVEERAELSMRERHVTEKRRATDRHAKAVAAPSTAGISSRPGGGGRGILYELLIRKKISDDEVNS